MSGTAGADTSDVKVSAQQAAGIEIFDRGGNFP